MFEAKDVAQVILNKELADKLFLCYVRGEWGESAWFTTNLEHTSGDDWNDAPYEHNASRPYHIFSTKEGVLYDEDGVLCEVMFSAHLETPSTGRINSPYSVDMINDGMTPWLKTPSWYKDEDSFEIYAGTSLTEFVRLIKQHGGSVFFEI